MTTDILDLPELSNSQVNHNVVVNQAFSDIERAGNDVLSVDLSGSDATILADDFRRHAMFACVGHSVARILSVPASKRLFLVRNGGTADINVRCGTTDVPVAAATAAVLYADGSSNGLFGISSGGGGGASAGVAVVNSTAGVLDLSAVEDETIKVLLSENVSSITFPAGASGIRNDLIIRFEQDGTGGWTVDLTGITWDGDGSPPAVAASPGDVTYITAVNVDNEGWEGFK